MLNFFAAPFTTHCSSSSKTHGIPPTKSKVVRSYTSRGMQQKYISMINSPLLPELPRGEHSASYALQLQALVRAALRVVIQPL